jgi:hypothetical protein
LYYRLGVWIEFARKINILSTVQFSMAEQRKRKKRETSIVFYRKFKIISLSLSLSLHFRNFLPILDVLRLSESSIRLEGASRSLRKKEKQGEKGKKEEKKGERVQVRLEVPT